MKENRRQFLREGSLAMLVVSLSPGAFAGQRWFRSMKTVPVEDLHLATFAGHLNSIFRVKCGPEQRSVELELIEAEERGARHSQRAGRDATGECFTLLFRGPANCALSQGNYAFQHAEIGRFEILITPVVSRDPGQRVYEAVFNRLQPPGPQTPPPTRCIV